MIKAIYILYALLPALLLHSAVATDLSEHFVTFPGARDVGGCDANKDKLQNGYKEAYLLVDNALKSLDGLSKQRLHFGADALSLSDSDKKDVREWDRQARLLKALFAIDTTPEKGVSIRESQDRLDQVKKNYQFIQNDEPNKKADNWLLYCTANYMSYVKRYSKTPWGQLIKGAQFVGGAFVWKAFPPTHKTNQIRPRDPNGEDTNPVVTFCGDGTQASTRNYNSEVYFCEAGLDIDTTLGPNYPITAGQGLPETTSSIWVHELVHVNTPSKHFIAPLSRNGNIIRSGKAYGFEDIANLARLVSADVITTADSYALYAVGLWLTEWDFADAKNAGKAIKMLGP